MKTIEFKEYEIDTLINWCVVELEVIEEKDFVNKNHFEGYKKEIKELLKKLQRK